MFLNGELAQFGQSVALLEVNYMEVELYCCYSLPLRDFLFENGLRYKLAALNPNSQELFWVYVKDEKLNNLLDRWSTNK